MIRCVVFDFDGTLVDSNSIKRDGFFTAVSSLPGGQELMKEVLAEVRGNRQIIFAAFTDRFMHNAAAGTVAMTAAELAARYSQEVDVRVAAAAAVDGAETLFHALRHEGRQLFINSSTPTANLKTIMERRGWFEHFDGVMGGPSSKIANLRCISTYAAVEATEFAVVGDGADDEDAAREFGCHFIPVGEGRTDMPRRFTLHDVRRCLEAARRLI